MDILTIGAIVLRRWFVIIPVLLLTGAGAVVIAERTQPEYSASASFLLVAAPIQATSSMPPAVTGQILADVLSSNRSTAGLSGRTAYNGEADLTGSYLHVEVSGPSASVVEADLNVLLERAPEELAALQEDAGIQPGLRSALSVLGEASSPEERTEIGPDGASRNEFTASAFLLVEPPRGVTPEGGRALPFPPSLFTVRVLSEAMSSPQVVREVRGSHKAAYAVSGIPRDSAPVLNVEVRGALPDDVLSLLETVSTALREQLAEIQAGAGVAPENQTALSPLRVPTQAELLSTHVMRPVATVLALGAAVAVAMALLLDSLLTRRRRRRTEGLGDEEPRIAEIADDGRGDAIYRETGEEDRAPAVPWSVPRS